VATPIKVLGIAGSLRAGSTNRALLRAAAEVAPDEMEIAEFDLTGIPFFDADVEAEGDPERVRELKEAIAAADAILIATPEYNGGTSGVLKNAIDWASRPPFHSPLAGKPVALMGASTGLGGTRRAQEQVRTALEHPKARVLEESLRVPESYASFEDGELADEATREALAELVETLAATVPIRELAHAA